MAELNIFQKSRAAVELLIQDTINYTVDQFKQARTNFTVASAYGQIIFVLQNLAQFILYYIEDSITELNINTATRPNSVYGLASLAGHNPTRAIAATGEITLLSKNVGADLIPGGTVVIPNYTKIKCLNNGLTYMLNLPTDEVRVAADGSNNGLAMQIIQGKIETQIFTGTGSNLQSFSPNFTQSSGIDHFNVNVYVNGEKWKRYDSFYDMPYDAKAFMIKTAIVSGGFDLFFGNKYFGRKPQLGAEIRTEYVSTNGAAGNLSLADAEEAQFKWDDPGLSIYGDDIDLNEAFVVKCPMPPDFGSDPESLKLTRLIAPKTSRSYVLANADNYIIFFEKFNMFSIIDAFSTFGDNNLDDDNVIYLFLIPDVSRRLKSNENYWNISEDRFALTDTGKQKILDLIERSGSKVANTVVQIIDPVISRYVINIALIIFQGAGYPDEATIRQTVLNRLSDYFLTIRRRDRIPRSDLMAIIEGIPGVDSVNISMVSEKDEMAITLKADAVPTGVDEFGDIIISADELPIIRGGWVDRRGLAYERTLDDQKPGSVNIVVRGIKNNTYNTNVNNVIKENIRK